MDSIGKYMLEIILHQHGTPQLLKQTKLMQTQEDHSNKIRALNVTLDYDSQMTEKYFVEYTRIEVKHFRDTLLQHMGSVKKSVFKRARHQRHGTESEVKDDNNRSGNDTDADNADIRPIYDEEPMAKVQLTAKCNIFTIGQQHTEQPEIISEGRVDHLNDMVHNHYLDEAKKKTQDKDRNSKPSVMTPARFQSTTADSKPKPRSTNHSSRSLPMSKSSCVTMPAMPKADHSKSPSSFFDHTRFFCSTCNKCVFNANHDACITKLLKEVNLRAKIQSHKTRDHNKPLDQKSHTQIPGRQIFTGHKFSPNKTFVVYEKISPRSDLRWQPTGRIFKSVGLRWLPTGKLFDSCTNKVKREPPHGSNVDISKIYKYKQTLDLIAGTSINVPKEQSLDVSAGILWNVNKENLRFRPRNTMSSEGIQHQMSVARTPEQNGIVERRNRTLVEAAQTMLSAAKVPLFFWAEAIATACFTQNRSLVIPRHEKTPYHIINDRKPSVKFFHIFGSVCYIVRDGENLDKIKEKGDECIFVGYST
uniref:Retrovirus-related Pol polyprotein from transposon TNT 1-94 n=1 Tax=Tanacetum cinerariifolium TaxID=118510 RepID=A0A6L2NDT4_TANCI|nr:retrovirus-related Pol polyprotein from transposon TNT 1-94 [Tanacetum cinerariifolium]